MDSKEMIFYQFAEDLFNLGLIKNKEYFISYCKNLAVPGDGLQVVQQVINNYCTAKQPKVDLAENVERDAQILCRLFPKYDLSCAKSLLNLFHLHGNRMKIVLSIMNLHNRMLNDVQNSKNDNAVANNIDAELKLNRYSKYQENYEHGPLHHNTRDDANVFTKRKPTATIVRPDPRGIVQALREALKTSAPYLPDEVPHTTKRNIAEESGPARFENMVTCKPLDALMSQNSAKEHETKECWYSTTPYLFPTDDNMINEEPEIQQENGTVWPTILPDVSVESMLNTAMNELPGTSTASATEAFLNTPIEMEGTYKDESRHNADPADLLPLPFLFDNTMVNSPPAPQDIPYRNKHETRINAEAADMMSLPFLFDNTLVDSPPVPQEIPRRNKHDLRTKSTRFDLEPLIHLNDITREIPKPNEGRPILKENIHRKSADPRTNMPTFNLPPFLDDTNRGIPKSSNEPPITKENGHQKLAEMHRQRTIFNLRKHNLSLSSNDSSHDNEAFVLPKHPRMENAIVLNDDSDNSDVSFTDIDDEATDLTLNHSLIDMSNDTSSVGAGASYCVKLSSHIMEMFPDACPVYIRSLCTGRKMTDADVDHVLQQMFSNPDYPKRDQRELTPPLEMDLETQTQLLKELFPEADPTYLEYHAQVFLEDPDGMKMFISKTLEKRNYPTKKDYLRRQQLNAQVRQYTTEFKVDKFLEVIPDPISYFKDADRCAVTLGDAVERHLCVQVLKNLYPQTTVRHIQQAYSRNNNLLAAATALDNYEDTRALMKSRRKYVSVDLSAVQNIPLLQQIAFLTNRELILNKVEEKKQQELQEREEAKANGLMQTCRCCYDDEVMLKDCATCENGCNFCKSCIQKSVEILFSEGKTEFNCLDICSAQFNLTTLRDALPPKLFSKVAQRKQLEEVKAAGIDNLISCPFCDFATIPPPGDKIFKCLNPECMKESCRECKEPSHVPLRCDEIEKDDDIKKRTYIENKMTEALVRVCYKCGMKFIKEDGCNKMTCSCGAQMCYLCLAPVKDYTHFNGQGGDKHHLCPLYSDTNQMHEEQVLRGAAEAKQELGVEADKQLKIDPTADVHKHYTRRQPRQAPIPRHNMPGPIRMVVNAVMEIDDFNRRALIHHARHHGRQGHHHRRHRH